MTWNNRISTKKVVQNNQEFLIGTFQIRQIRQFTRYTEHLVVGVDEVDDDERVFESTRQLKPIYNPEIQRKVNNAKVGKIADYLINDPNAMFPTNIVVSIPKAVILNIQEDNKEVEVTLDDLVYEEVQRANGAVYLTIIDGQHRIRGIEKAISLVEENVKNIQKVLSSSSGENEKLQHELKKSRSLLNRLLSFELCVTFFIDPTLEYQAMIFATINKTQTKVPENLVYSLFGLTKDDSPQKTSLEVVLALNGIEKSPFFNRIKLVGGAYQKGQLVPLSQATMVKSILKSICNNLRESEIDRFKKRRELLTNPKNLAFRKYYALNQDSKIVRILYSFFSAVRDTFKDSNNDSLWTLSESGKITNVLQTNVGYQALLKVLFHILKDTTEEERDSKSYYSTLLIKAISIDFIDNGEEKRYPYTSSSVNILYSDILAKIDA
jgi:DGQHR domain-containing protein